MKFPVHVQDCGNQAIVYDAEGTMQIFTVGVQGVPLKELVEAANKWHEHNQKQDRSDGEPTESWRANMDAEFEPQEREAMRKDVMDNALHSIETMVEIIRKAGGL